MDPSKLEITRLVADGSNWASYRDKLHIVLKMRRWQEHLTSDVVTQAYKDRGEINGLKAPMRWEDDDEAVKSILMSSIPEEFFNRIKGGANAKAWWDELKLTCEGKSRSLMINLGRRMSNTFCGEDDDVRAHFAKLANMREQLAAMGESISDQHYANILLASLPKCYEMRVTAITTNADDTGRGIEPQKVVRLITDDYDRTTMAKEAKKTEDQAFAASSQRNKGKDKRDVECYNCKKKGHIKANCWAKGGGKEGQGPKRDKNKSKDKDNDSAAPAVDKTDDTESWAIIDEDLFDLDEGTDKTDGTESWAAIIDEDFTDFDENAEKIDITESWAAIEEDFSDVGTEYEDVYIEESDEDTLNGDDDIDNQPEHVASSAGDSEVELYDSGASRHISPFRQRFLTYRSIPPRPIAAADKHKFYAVGTGDLKIQVPNGASATPMILRDALHAPDIGLTVVSIGRIAKAGHVVSFKGDTCKITNSKGKTIGNIPISANGLYKAERVYAAAAVLEIVDIITLHRRLGHISLDTIRNIIRNNIVTGIQLIDDKPSFFCESCEHAKAMRKPINKERQSDLAEAFGDEIHSDLWGPSRTATIGGRKYYVTFTDDFSRYTRLELLRTKDETLDAYKTFAAWAQTQHNVKIKRLRSDRGGEYTGNDFTKYLKAQGTERRLTTRDTPQHNSVAESLNRRLLECVRAILHHSQLSSALWGEAIMFAIWLKNRTSTRALGNTTPYERLYKNKPDLSGVPEWGQKVWVHSPGGSKLDARAIEGRWVGFDRDSTHAHRVYWPGQRRVTVERDLKFVPTTVTVYSPTTSVPHVSPQVQQSSHALGAPSPATPLPPPTPTSTPTRIRPGATDSGEDEMPDEEEVPSASTPASSTTFGSESSRGGQTPTQPPGAPKKSKISPFGFTTRRSARLAEREQARRTPASTRPTTTTSQSSTSTQQRHVPGEFPIFRGTHPDYTRPNLPEDEASLADVEFDSEDEDEDEDDEDDEPVVKPVKVNIHVMVMDAMQDEEGDPKTLREAKARADWPRWKEAMDREIATLDRAKTWITVPRPEGKNIVGSKWVFRIKRKADGSIEKYKARLVARGFTQVFGEDYYDTFSPVAKLQSFRAILALAARFDWEIESFDFTGAYLNGELDADEEIYMQPPPGYEGQGPDEVKRLRKSLYGLKQAGRKWYDALSRALANLGFRTTQADPGVFVAYDQGHILILVVHVDDCTFTGSSAKLIFAYKKKINDCYALTDLGPISWLLGIKITRNREERTISLSQSSYIDSILERYGLKDAKPYATPMVPGVTYSRRDSPSTPTEAHRMRRVPYREAIGSLMYAAVATRPDITFAVSTLSQFLDNPGDAHWEAVKRIIRYLSGTRGATLTYGEDRHDLIGYTDTDGATQEHRRAISGHVFLIDGGAISWSSRKQELVTLSTAEAEYVATTHAAKEALWLRRLIHELFPSLKQPTPLYCDNLSTLKLIYGDNYHARTKHIDTRYHFIRQVARNGALVLTYCPSEDMTADTLTKALPKWKATIHNSSLGLRLSA